MKFLCIDCDTRMEFEQRAQPGDGTFAAAFACPACGRRVAMLANPMETQLVSSLGIKVGGRDVPEQPLESIRSGVTSGRSDAFDDLDAAGAASDPVAGTQDGAGTTMADDSHAGPRAAAPVTWSVEAVERLSRVPSFVRGMVKRIYADYAKERGIEEITPAVMDRARQDLGLEGM